MDICDILAWWGWEPPRTVTAWLSLVALQFRLVSVTLASQEFVTFLALKKDTSYPRQETVAAPHGLTDVSEMHQPFACGVCIHRMRPVFFPNGEDARNSQTGWGPT